MITLSVGNGSAGVLSFPVGRIRYQGMKGISQGCMDVDRAHTFGSSLLIG